MTTSKNMINENSGKNVLNIFQNVEEKNKKKEEDFYHVNFNKISFILITIFSNLFENPIKLKKCDFIFILSF